MAMRPKARPTNLVEGTPAVVTRFITANGIAAAKKKYKPASIMAAQKLTKDKVKAPTTSLRPKGRGNTPKVLEGSTRGV
tara:strand:- start:62 stop:298 length:237 start_codon:yes stop_codon:yes gene_type:complete